MVANEVEDLAIDLAARYDFVMSSPQRVGCTQPQLWSAHPDDAEDVREAMACADRGEFLSPGATEAFLRWMAGTDDQSWRDELE